MKKYLFLCATLYCAISSCSNSVEQPKDMFTTEERAKIELIKAIFLENGWELDSTVSDEERDRMLLNTDIDEIRDFAENFCWDHTTSE